MDIRLIGTGNSQSAGRLTSYVLNGAQADAGVYDSLLVLNGGSTTFVGGELPSVPLIHMQSESEASAPVFTDERPTGRLVHPLYRLWWVAGSSHTQPYHNHCHSNLAAAFSAAGADPDRECGQYGELGGTTGDCFAVPNMFPKRYAAAAAIDALDAWMRTGEPAAASSAEFAYDASGNELRDADNNILGGLRLPPTEVPVASYVGNQCALLGRTEPFQDVGSSRRRPRPRWPTMATERSLRQERALDPRVALRDRCAPNWTGGSRPRSRAQGRRCRSAAVVRE